jgi:hypothetical protein
MELVPTDIIPTVTLYRQSLQHYNDDKIPTTTEYRLRQNTDRASVGDTIPTAWYILLRHIYKKVLFLLIQTARFAWFKLELIDGSSEKVNKIEFRRKKLKETECINIIEIRLERRRPQKCFLI